MIDKATQTIARHLGISAHNIHSWSFSCDYDRRAKMANRLVVYCSPEHAEMVRLQNLSPCDWVLESCERELSYGASIPEIRLTFSLLYGKQTQHLMKALHQTMTVRGPKRRKK